MNDKLEKIQKIAEVSHINFLLGAGASQPFIPTKPDIESGLNKAKNEGNESKLISLKKDFFTEVIKPCLKIKDYVPGDEGNEKLGETLNAYQSFFEAITEYILIRKSSLLDKQVNLFTTNIDIFPEKTLENINVNYNDGFAGNLSPSFDTSNFGRIVKNRSEHRGKHSEVPTFNLYKIHGSTTWELDSRDQISYSDLSLLEKIQKAVEEEDDEKFDKLYSKLQIINPNQEKFEKSVLHLTYYELLRLYTTALERQNALLIVAGFSFSDEHILELTKRAVNSNPTLTVIIFSHRSDGVSDFEDKFQDVRYENSIEVIGPEVIDGDTETIDIRWISENFIKKLPKHTYSNT